MLLPTEGKAKYFILINYKKHTNSLMSHPNTVVPRLSFRLQRLDPESVTHCSTTQTVAALYLVCYDPHLHPDNENTSQDTWHFL